MFGGTVSIMYSGALLTTLQAEEWDLHGCECREGVMYERTRCIVQKSPRIQ